MQKGLFALLVTCALGGVLLGPGSAGAEVSTFIYNVPPAEMRTAGESFFHFAKRRSEQHHDYFKGLPLDPERRQRFAQEARRSLEQQQEIEAADELPFDEFLRRYFAQTLPVSG